MQSTIVITKTEHLIKGNTDLFFKLGFSSLSDNMHSFTTFFIAATLVLTALVSAATIGKEDLIFDPISECVDHINIIKNRLELLNAERRRR
ncbi:unnamed protein product [Mucor hiemalis]